MENETPAQPRVIRLIFRRNLTMRTLKPIKTGRVAISHQLFNHIKETYNLTGRFIVNQQTVSLRFSDHPKKKLPTKYILRYSIRKICSSISL